MSFVQISRKEGEREEENNGKERLTVWTHAINCRALWKVVGTLGLSNKSLAKKNLLVRKHVRSLILSQSFGAQFWVKVLGIFNHPLLKSDYIDLPWRFAWLAETKLEQKRTKRKKIAINLCLGDRAIITFALTNVFGPWPFLSPPAIHLRLHSSCNFHSDNLIKRPKGAEMSCRERANVASLLCEKILIDVNEDGVRGKSLRDVDSRRQSEEMMLHYFHYERK